MSPVYTIEELQDLAYRLMARPKPTKRALSGLPTYLSNGDKAGIFAYWLEHKEVGTPVTPELEVHTASGGGVAVITARGVILHWPADNSGVVML